MKGNQLPAGGASLMALIQPTLGTMSGKIAGNVFSHNAGGQYVRQWVVPTNPSTSEQQAVRGIFGALSSHWQTTLTQAQRDAWSTFAANVPVLNRQGAQVHINGLAWYNKANTPRIQAGLPRVDDGPTVFALDAVTTAALVSTITAPTGLSQAFGTGDAWMSEDDAGLLVYASRPQADTINYFTGPYRFAGVVLGDGTTPPTSPAAITLPFTAAAGQKVFIRIMSTRADGRPSSSFRDFDVAA